ncbi:hypothetical protein MHF_0234 [Mycoplasma haemofelis Ohio2]|uniref:Uncharacterized protein n=1 Tax=Mycoplasma haemofelis (strain Ohio2) TaxID=859194 RepID=F6FGD9_MYCHI|nr:hypothetical protein MHF_0234 [Mycoplasma haemofelis Ohio2]
MDAKLAALAGLGASAGGAGAFGIYKLANPEDKVKTFTDEEYQLIFREFKSEESFITALQTKNSQITNQSSNTDGGKAAKDWCVGNKSKDAKKWCVQLPSTIEAKLLSLNKKLVTNWETKLESIKSAEGLDADLKAIDKSITQTLTAMNGDKNKFSEALQKWCSDNLSKKLIEDESTFTKAEKRCVNDN